jgi:hypothetical protein
LADIESLCRRLGTVAEFANHAILSDLRGVLHENGLSAEVRATPGTRVEDVDGLDRVGPSGLGVRHCARYVKPGSQNRRTTC